MALLTIATAMFVSGVVSLGLLQWITGRLARPLHLPMEALDGLFTGIGFLVTMPFVFTILFKAHASVWAFAGTGVALLTGAALATGYGVYRLVRPALAREFARA